MAMKTTFGELPDGTKIDLYELRNSKGMVVQIHNYGATIKSIRVPDSKGRVHDVALGYDNLEGYLRKGNPYFGCIVGRVANRIANGKFRLDGQNYTLAQNNGKNSLHGGLKGFDKQVWEGHSQSQDEVTFSYFSEDGEEGYPGKVLVNVKYTLTDENSILIDMTATTTKATPINLANHCYFNLGGHNAGSEGLYRHQVSINADKYTPVDESSLIPTGEIAEVNGTLFDLRVAKKLGDILPRLPGGQNNGYDHNFCVNQNKSQEMSFVMAVEDPVTGIRFECHSNQPGVQFYTGNFLPKDASLEGKSGAKYGKHGGFCAETQIYPDAINQIHQNMNFPDVVIRPGDVYKHKVSYKFSVA